MKKLTIFSSLFFFSFVLFASDGIMEVKEGTATVDGNDSDWTEADFFTDMYNGFNNNDKDQVLTKLYLKYDTFSKTMYVLVKTTNTEQDILLSGDDAYVKTGDGTKILDGNYTGPLFQWLGPTTTNTKNEEVSFGYEGKIVDFFNKFPDGQMTLSINVHANVSGSTLDEQDPLTSGLIQKTISLKLPEGGDTPPPSDSTPGVPIDGGLSFLLAAGLGYGVYKKRK